MRLRLGQHAFFHQARPGRDGAPFSLHKFRTMTDSRTPGGQLLPDAARLTQFGASRAAPASMNHPNCGMCCVARWPDGRDPCSRVSQSRHSETGAPRGPPRYHRLGTGERPQRYQLGAEVRLRRLGTSTMSRFGLTLKSLP